MSARPGGTPIPRNPCRPVRSLTPVSCGFTPFYDHNVLLPNGDLVICCMDYSIKHKIGNLIEGDCFSLFASRGMAELHAENTKPATAIKRSARVVAERSGTRSFPIEGNFGKPAKDERRRSAIFRPP